MRRFFGGLQPLWGTGVTSAMLLILRPSAFRARTADSRPGPGPLMRTSRFFTPHSCAARPACSAATCAAVGAAGGFAMGPRSLSAGLRGGRGNLDGGLARTLARARVGAGALAANRQPLAVTSAAIAAQVHQPLDIHRYLAAQVALDGESCDLLAQALHVGL